MARFEATTAIVAVLLGAGVLAASSCEDPESFQHSGNSSFLGGTGGRGAVAGAGGRGGGEGGLAIGDSGGAGGLTGAAGGETAAAGGGPGDAGGAGGDASGAAGGGGGVAEGGQPAASAGAGGRALIGTAGAAGTGRAMGSGGAAGAGVGGTVAAGGRSGAGASGGTGAGGLAGTAGQGGAGGVESPCGTCTLSIQCRNYAPTDTTSMNIELWISNTGDQAIPLGMIKVRYYYTNEGGPMTLEIFDKAFKGTDGSGYQTAMASFSMTSGKLTKPPMDFSEIAIKGASALGDTPFYFKMAIHDLNHSKLTLTNDYSNPPASIGPCPTIVALVGTAVAGGVPPK